MHALHVLDSFVKKKEMVTSSSSEEDSECDCGPSQLALEMVSVKLSVFDYGLSVVQKKDQEDGTGRPIVLLAYTFNSDHTYFFVFLFFFVACHCMPCPLDVCVALRYCHASRPVDLHIALYCLRTQYGRPYDDTYVRGEARLGPV